MPTRRHLMSSFQAPVRRRGLIDVPTVKRMIRNESPWEIEIGTVIAADTRGIQHISVRTSGGRTLSRVYTCVEDVQPGDQVIVVRSEGMDRMIAVGKVMDSYSTTTSRGNISLAPPENFAAGAWAGMAYCIWDTYPGEDLSWQVQYALESDKSDATDILVTRGSYYLHPCTPETTVYFRIRAVRWLGNNNVQFSSWSGWSNDVSENYEVPKLVIELTNKSGSAVSEGWVVIIDTGNAESFDLTTTEGDEGVIGVAIETIANNATGTVCISGQCNVYIDGAASIGSYLITDTDAGYAKPVASKQVGTFGRALESGSGLKKAIITSLASSTSSGSAYGEVLTVAKGGGGQYTTVAGAATDFSAGDIIWVLPGNYAENVTGAANMKLEFLRSGRPWESRITGSDDTGPALDLNNESDVHSAAIYRQLSGGSGEYTLVKGDNDINERVILTDSYLKVDGNSQSRDVVALKISGGFSEDSFVWNCQIIATGSSTGNNAIELAGRGIRINNCDIEGDVVVTTATDLILRDSYIDGDLTGTVGSTLHIGADVQVTGTISGWGTTTYHGVHGSGAADRIAYWLSESEIGSTSDIEVEISVPMIKFKSGGGVGRSGIGPRMLFNDVAGYMEDGRFGIEEPSPAGQAEIKQPVNDAAIPALVLDQTDVDQPFIEFQTATIYTSKTGEDEYLMVKDPNGNTRYIRLYS